MNIRSLSAGLTFLGRGKGVKQTYSVFEGKDVYFVFSFSRSKPKAGYFNAVISGAVPYALRLAGRWDGNIRRRDLEIDSPYNTYRYPGLPPGPICSPGRASLAAAATPAQVPYLYFVSRNDGSHAFARTLAEHNRNVERWQREYWRKRWAEERAAAARVD